MIIRDITFKDASENIFYDQILLQSAEDGKSGEVLRFWESKEFFVVLGRISRVKDDVKLDEVHNKHTRIIRRISGGGAVLQGPGCLNYALVLSFEVNPLLRNIRKSYEFILGKICRALNKLNVKVEFEPVSDIAVGGRKFSGNAQARKRKYMLHHGTILYKFPLELMEEYLTMPKDQPPYRKGRSHKDFLANINLDPWDIKQAIASEFTGAKNEQDRSDTRAGKRKS